MVTYKQLLEKLNHPEPDPGIYTNYSLSPDSAKELLLWCKENLIVDPLAPEDFHVTLIYSEVSLQPGYPLNEPEKVEIDDSSYFIDILGDNETLVLRFESSILLDKYKIAKELGAVFTYPAFKPHITLSYTVQPEKVIENIKVPNFKIVLSGEHSRPVKKRQKEEFED